MIKIGVDLGGTKIEAIVFGHSEEVLFRERVPTSTESYEAILTAIHGLLNFARDKVKAVHGIDINLSDPAAVGIGFGTPGALSLKTGLIKNANSTKLNGHPLDKDIAALLGRPIKLANDANCLALSEAHDGAGAGAPVVFTAILGTGVGGGIVVNGYLINGINSIGGEWGHNPLPQFGAHQTIVDTPTKCYCGQSGCIETWLSGPGFAKDSGMGLPAYEVIEQMRKGNVIATAAFERYVDRLARALASVINLLDPDVIVLGGGLSQITELYERVPKVWGRYVFSDFVATRLVPSQHGDSSGVRGAAWL